MNNVQEMLPDELQERLASGNETKEEKLEMIKEIAARAYLQGYRDGLVDGKKF